jgi:hypothetical protein
MWNNFKRILLDQDYKRLGLALCASVALHALLFGGFDFALPSLKKEMHVIEARLQMPKAVVEPVEEPKPEEIATPEPIPKPPKPKPPKKEKPVEPPPVVEESIESNEPAPEPVPPVEPPVEPPPPQIPPEAAPPELPKEEPQPVDAGLIINENAYQYVETEFDVRTKIDGSTEGKATITYNLVDNQYHLKSVMEARGLAALVISDLLQTSEGALTKSGLQPSSYLYQYGDNADKARNANFDWKNRVVSLQTSKGVKKEELPDGTQDLLSFMYQFMYVAPLQTMQIPIATGKKLAIYDYSFEGEENLNIKLGELKTIHIVHSGNNDEEKTELWLAIDYQYVPVKIRKIEKNGKVYEMVATRINTNRPTVDNSQNN